MANRFQPLINHHIEITIDENNNEETRAVPNVPLLNEEMSESDGDEDIPADDEDTIVTWGMAQETGEFHRAYSDWVHIALAREAQERDAHSANIEAAAGHSHAFVGEEHDVTNKEDGHNEVDVEDEGHNGDCLGHPGADKEGDISDGDEDDDGVKGEPSKHQVCTKNKCERLFN